MSAQACWSNCLREPTPKVVRGRPAAAVTRHRLLTGRLVGTRPPPWTAGRLIVPAARRMPGLFGAAVHALAAA